MKIIKTNRPWNLRIKNDGAKFVKIQERHEGSDFDASSYVNAVCVPEEAIDEVIETLIFYRNKMKGEQ